MNIGAYQKRIASIVRTELMCSCCGASVYSLSEVQESICNFCEAYVNYNGKDVAHGNGEIEKSLKLMHESIVQRNWTEGVQHADALAATKDPFMLFGASSFYSIFSDYIYYGVDYTLGGFMYDNAQRRSDELQKNKYNAVALISKSREYLFNAMKVINSSPNPDDPMMFINFMANMKLKRVVQARRTLADMNSRQTGALTRSYANMVFSTETNAKGTDTYKYIDSSLYYGISNSLYYLSKHIAMTRQLSAAIDMLDALAAKTSMPAAMLLSYLLKGARAASGL